MGKMADARSPAMAHVLGMNKLMRWSLVVGAFYVLQAVGMAVLRLPIKTFGPEGALEMADGGDAVARFLVDTWFTFGLEVAAVGIALLVASRRTELLRGVAWTVLGIEVLRGVLNDIVMIARGIEVPGYLVWIAIHSVVIATGVAALRAAYGESTEKVSQDSVPRPR